MNQTFKIGRRLDSIKVDKTILKEIENYCFLKLPDYLTISEEQIKLLFSTKINETNGEQNIDTIDNYEFSQFPDDTIYITTGFFYRDPVRDSSYYLNICFSKEYYHSIIMIEIKSEYAKEKAIGINDHLLRIIYQNKTSNFLFHPTTLASGILFGLGICSLPFSLIFVNYNIKLTILTLILSSLLLLYLFFLKSLKPYCSFDTNRQNKNDIYANYFLLGLLTFLVFSTGFVFLRDWLIGK